MLVHDDAPLNAEPPRGALAGEPITALDHFYVRNHGEVPAASPGWRLSVGGLVSRGLDLSVEELRGRFDVCSVVATLQCAGNRREGLIAVRDIPGEAPWGPGATATARWEGVRLRDVLEAAGVGEGAAHVAFVGVDWSEEASPAQAYGASVPLSKALGDEVLLAWAMNGAPLSPEHGAPLRVVVPGWIGARSVKWVSSIELRPEPWGGYYQQVAYRLLPVDGEPAPGAGVELGEIALNSDVLSPDGSAPIAAGVIEVTGYAFAGGGRTVARVDVSVDGGATWQQAELLDDLGRWAWRHWRLVVDLDAGRRSIVVRAWDSAGALQPEDPASLWNPKGYVNNAWGRVEVEVR